jgi:hypothetical protein
VAKSLGRARRQLALGFVVLAAVAVAVWLAVERGSSAAPSIAAADSAVLVNANGKLGTAIRVGASPGHAVSGGGFLWTSNERDGTVSRIDIADRAVETIPVGHSPEGLAFADGHVWVANGGDASISRIDPRAGRSYARSESETARSASRRGTRPLGLEQRRRHLARVDTRSGRVTTVPVGLQPDAVAAGPDAVWVALARLRRGRRARPQLVGASSRR